MAGFAATRRAATATAAMKPKSLRIIELLHGWKRMLSLPSPSRSLAACIASEIEDSVFVETEPGIEFLQVRFGVRQLYHDARRAGFVRVRDDSLDQPAPNAASAARFPNVQVAQEPDAPAVPRRPERIELNETLRRRAASRDENHGVGAAEPLLQKPPRLFDVLTAREK